VVAARAGVLDGLPGVPPGFVQALSSAADAARGALAGVDTGSPVFLAVAGGLAALLILAYVFFAVRSARRGRRAEGGGALYTAALRWSLRHRLAVVVVAVLAFVGGLATIPFLAVSFFPPSEERLLQATAELPSGTTVEETSEKLNPFEDFLLKDPGVEAYQLSVGGEDDFNADTPLRAGNQAQAFITVKEGADVSRTLSRVEGEGRDLYGDDFQTQVLNQGPPTGGLEVQITGGSERALREASDLVTRELRGTAGLTNVESDLSEVSPEVQVALDPEKAAAAGLSPTQVSTSLGALLGGGAPLRSARRRSPSACRRARWTPSRRSGGCPSARVPPSGTWPRSARARPRRRSPG
jgi:HAE1 family hydrophobic/amphiphilic exporter-1